MNYKLMNDNYLWDKTGSDPETEELENALQAFRYRETAAPALPSNKIVSLRRKPARRILPLTLAAAACLTVAALALAIWVQIFTSRTAVEEDSAKSIEPSVNENLVKPIEPGANVLATPQTKDSNGLIAQNSATAAAKKIESSKQNVASPKVIRQQKSVSRRKLIATTKRQITTANDQTAKSAIALTEEERLAYNRLLLALSITGSKLRLVKDKVEGMD